jgi:uncharacterized protein
MAPNIPLILHAILEDYALPWGGDHGVAHWARVLENGLRLAEETSANIEVVSLFAILHDSRRVNEGTDPDHGPRAAEFAESLRGLLFDLPEPEFRLLHRACSGHTRERTHPDVTIWTCWDADRLDLGRAKKGSFTVIIIAREIWIRKGDRLYILCRPCKAFHKP